MAYSGSSDAPCTDGKETKLVRPSDVPPKIWGDRDAGFTTDSIYISTESLHLAQFSVPQGEAFLDSSEFKSLINADVYYYVLAGELLLANPKTGEMTSLSKGDSVLLRPNTWHHGFNIGSSMATLLEFISPPPSHGTTFEHFADVQIIEAPSYGQDDLLENWPSIDQGQSSSIGVVRASEVSWRLEGAPAHVPTAIHVSSEMGTLGSVSLRAGQQSGWLRNGGAKCLFTLRGQLTVGVEDSDRERWFQLDEESAIHLPAGKPHRFFNMTESPVASVFFVGPPYLS